MYGRVQYFVEANAIALRRVSKEDMRHIAKATGATQVNTIQFTSISARVRKVRMSGQCEILTLYRKILDEYYVKNL